MEWIGDLSPAMERQVIALARRAVETQPGNPACRHSLAEALRKAGRAEDARAVLDEALALFPGDALLLQGQARAAQMTGDWPAALAALDRLIASAPETAGARLARCDVLFRLQDDAAAEKALRDLEDSGAGSGPYFQLKLKQLQREGREDEMLALCDRQLGLPATRTSAVFHKIELLLRLGRSAEAQALLDLDRLAEIGTLDDDAKAFRDSLADEILRNPTLVSDPAGKATLGGLQTRSLRQPGATTTDALLERVKARIERYLARLRQAGHPFAAFAPAKARLHAWAVVYSASGRQRVHHHSDGWLSGVFYVRAPLQGASYSGSLLLGAVTGEGRAAVRHPGVREIEPVPGRLVMFPSYVPHASLPPQDDNSRIIVSFDVVPAGGAENAFA